MSLAQRVRGEFSAKEWVNGMDDFRTHRVVIVRSAECHVEATVRGSSGTELLPAASR